MYCNEHAGRKSKGFIIVHYNSNVLYSEQVDAKFILNRIEKPNCLCCWT